METVCLDARMLGYSGIGTYIRSLVFHLQSAPFRLSLIISPKAARAFPIVKAFETIICKSPIYSTREQIELPYLIPKCALFWSPHFNVPLLPIYARKRLLTLHDAYHLAHFSSLTLLEKLYVKSVLKQGVRRADHIATVSTFSKSEICRYLSTDKKKVSVIPLGVPLSSPLSALSIREVKRKYALPDHFFLFVSAIKPHKNLKGALTAYRQLSENLKRRCPFFIIGKKCGLVNSDPILSLIQSERELKGKVHFLGSIPDSELFVFYHLATALIFPSFYEGFGLPPLEAMSRGCPAIVSRIPSLQEVCAEAAYYVLPSNPQTITKAMREVLTQEEVRSALIQKGRERAKLFTFKKTAERTIELIEKMITS